MGKPLLLLEAVSSYRGDLEDRLTELFATALAEHDGFCRELMATIGVTTEFERIVVRTQQSFLEGPARLDVVIRAFDASGRQVVVVFVENKYNPRKLPNPYWFSDDQARRQSIALEGESALECYLIAIASDRDLRRPIPPEYQHKLGWRDIAETANRAGGDAAWRDIARLPTASVAQRVLLEFWAYLKGDPVGPIDNDDLEALGRIVRAEDRVASLLEHVAEALRWEDGEVSADWLTGGESPIQYVAVEADEDSWLGDQRGGTRYVLVANAEWHDTTPVGQPYVYAGGGFSAKREERAALAAAPWSKEVQKAGMNVFSDAEGMYMLAGAPLAEVLADAETLSGQARLIAEWAEVAIAAVNRLPKPPNLSARTTRPSGSPSRRRIAE